MLCQTRKRGYHLGRSLHQFDQHAFAADGEFFIALGVQKANIKTCGAFANATWCETHTLGGEPLHSFGQVVDP